MPPGSSTTDEHRPLAGRLACVTGGGRGIGAAIAEKLDALGAELVLVGRTEESLRSTCERLGNARYRCVDVTDSSQVNRLFEWMGEGPDILINNAGGSSSAPFGRTTDEQWDRTLAVNLSGAFYCTRAALEPMRERNYGRIVNVASTAALTGYRYVAAYCAAKHGVLGMTRALALEVSSTGITVNAVCPGFTETDLLKTTLATITKTTRRSEEEARTELEALNPQGRFIQPSEVAATVAWLVSDEARSITGQAIPVAGGEVM